VYLNKSRIVKNDGQREAPPIIKTLKTELR